MNRTGLFSIRKQTILKKIKEIKEVCAGVLEYVEHILPRIDTEIFKKWRFRMKTSISPGFCPFFLPRTDRCQPVL